MIAYKFLGEGAVGLYSGFTWPIGEWVEVTEPLEPSRRGIHACRLGDLPHWLDAELWTVELEGEVLESERTIVASRGRLLERVPGWDAQAMRDFVVACLARGNGLPGLAEDAAEWDYDPPSAAFMPAHAIGLEAARAGRDYWSAFFAERVWQASWLAERLGLAHS